VNYASKQGYPTLAIDRLGNGASDKPDPIIYVQYPFHVEILHKLLRQIRGLESGSALPRTFNKIIFVGHSFGSIIGNALVAKYPNDVDSLLLTGYSNNILLNGPGVALNSAFLPTRLVMPTNPKYNILPLGYLQLALHSAFDYLFYHPGGFDPALEQQDYTNRGTVSAGELATATLGINTAAAFTGPVYVVTGKYDNIFCDTDCGTETSGELVNTRVDYPAASSFDVHIVPNAGHCWHNHYTAGDAFINVHSWLASKGF
jgi:pimeloyl-ACP methyl ester carboxylesterase